MASVDWPQIKRKAHSLYGRPFLYQPIDHPTFKGWQVARRCDDRLQPILETLNPIQGKRGLDIGSCYSKDTEILTEAGWKNFEDVSYEDLVATLNPKTHNLEYKHPQKIIKKPYSGKMLHQHGKSIDLLVTQNHMMYIKKATWSGENTQYSFIKAEEAPRHICYKRNCNWEGKEKKWFELPPVDNPTRGIQRKLLKIPMDDFLHFLGLWIADGYTTYKKGRKYLTGVTQIKTETRPIVKEIIMKLGFNVIEDKNDFVISHKQLHNYLYNLGKSKSKFIPKEIKGLSSRQLKILLNGLLLGDGSEDRKYFTSSKKLADDVQEIVLKIGYASTIGTRDKQLAFNKYVSSERYIVSITRKRQFEPNPNAHIDKRKWINYDGFVYCVTVPNHIIYVRRKGKACWCGNCTGWFSHRLAEHGTKMVGVEPTKTRVEIARAISQSRGLPPSNPRFIIGRFEDYLPGKRFDFALCLSLLQHYMRRSLREAWDVVDLISRHCDALFLDVAENRLPVKWRPELILEHSAYEGYTRLLGDEDYAGGRPFYVFRR